MTFRCTIYIYYFIAIHPDDINDGVEFMNNLEEAQEGLQTLLGNYTSDEMKNEPENIERIFKVEVTEVA